jgi:hypothetical protein
VDIESLQSTLHRVSLRHSFFLSRRFRARTATPATKSSCLCCGCQSNKMIDCLLPWFIQGKLCQNCGSGTWWWRWGQLRFQEKPWPRITLTLRRDSHSIIFRDVRTKKCVRGCYSVRAWDLDPVMQFYLSFMALNVCLIPVERGLIWAFKWPSVTRTFFRPLPSPPLPLATIQNICFSNRVTITEQSCLFSGCKWHTVPGWEVRVKGLTSRTFGLTVRTSV